MSWRKNKLVFTVGVGLLAGQIVTAQPALYSGAGEGANFSNPANWRDANELLNARMISFAQGSTTRETPAVLDAEFDLLGKSLDVQDYGPAGANLLISPSSEVRPASLRVGQTGGKRQVSPGIVQLGNGARVITAARNNGQLLVGTGAAGALILMPESFVRFGRIHFGEKGQVALVADSTSIPFLEQWQSADREADYRFDGRLIVHLQQLEQPGTHVILRSELAVLQGRLAAWLNEQGGKVAGAGSGVHGNGVFEIAAADNWNWTLNLTDAGRNLRLELSRRAGQ